MRIAIPSLLLTAALAAGLLTACGGHPPEGSRPAAPKLVAVPEPELGPLSEPVQKQLRSQRAELDRAVAKGSPTGADLARLYGEMGRLYQAYKLQEPALACLENAESLAPGELRWAYLLGVLHQDRGEAEPAVEHLKRALGAEPGYLPALLRLGDLELERNRPEGAGGYFSRALEADPSSAAAHYGLGRIAYNRGDYPTAIRELEAVLEEQPGAANVQYLLGQAYRATGDLEKAKEHLARFAPGNVSFSDPLVEELQDLVKGAGLHIDRGIHLFGEGRYAEAIAEYKAAIAADPDNLTAQRGLALVQAQSGDLDGAIEQLHKVLAMAPHHKLARLDLGTTLLEKGDLNGAVRELRGLLRDDPGFKEAHFNLGVALSRQGNWKEAEAELASALELDESDLQARYYHAMALDELGREKEAEAELRKVVTADPSHVAAHQRLGALLAKEGDLDGAAAQHRAVLAIDDAPKQEKALAHFQLGLLAGRRQAWQEAVSQYRQAVSLFPDLWQARFNLANTLTRLGKPSEAADELAAVVEAEPKNVLARRRLAAALAGAGRWSEARKALEEGIALLPQSGDLAHELARLLATAPDPEVRDPGRALELARQIFTAQRTAEHAETLAMALAAHGDFDQAVRLQRSLVEAAEQQGEPAVARELRRNLERYERQEPARAPSDG